MFFRLLIVIVAVWLATSIAVAKDAALVWNWYYVQPAYTTDSSGLRVLSKPDVSYGKAEVAIGSGRIKAVLQDEPPGDVQGTYSGTISKQGKVSGELRNFYPDGGPVAVSGQYTRTTLLGSGPINLLAPTRV